MPVSLRLLFLLLLIRFFRAGGYTLAADTPVSFSNGRHRCLIGPLILAGPGGRLGDLFVKFLTIGLLSHSACSLPVKDRIACALCPG